MALTAPYKQHHYMGEAASDAVILNWLQTNLWTHDGTGAGNPIKGMLYYNSTIKKLKVYANGAWEVVISGAGLDAAYVAGQTIDVDIADLAISFTGTYSFTVDLAGITGDVDGFFIEDTDNVEYIRATMNNTGAGIDWSADVRSIIFEAREDSRITVDGADLTFSTITTGDIAINSVGLMDIDAVNTLSINSSGGIINIGNDIINRSINVGTAGARTIAIGSAAATAVNIDGLAVSIDAVNAMNVTAGAASDLTLGARGATIPLNEVGETTLDASFTATSIIGCFNELKNGPLWMSSLAVNIAMYTVNAGDEYAILHVTRTTAGPCAITFQSAWIAIDGNTIWIKDTGRNSLANNITILTQGAELFEGDAAGGIMKSDGACWRIQTYNGNLYVIT